MPRVGSWHSSVAAVLGGAAVAGDFLPAFVGPAVDLAAGAAVAAVAVDAALTVAGENDSRMAARDIVVQTVRAAKLDRYSTPAARSTAGLTTGERKSPATDAPPRTAATVECQDDSRGMTAR